MASRSALALGLDFGTESVRALLVDLRGRERGSGVARYKHGQITTLLPGSGERLPAEFALQHPRDWIDASAKAVRQAMRQAGAAADHVIGIGVDFTSCTMLSTLSDGTPLCMTDSLCAEKYAWPKLWKHHAALEQTDRINAVARRRKEKWLDRYGGIVGLEWFFPKVLETLQRAPHVYDAADVWLEAGDWYVWQLVGGPADQLPRSTCQAGYKAMWNDTDGYPSAAFFKALDPRMTHVVRDKLPGRMLPPGKSAGQLTTAMARRFGVQAGTAVSAATIDAHAGVPGAGVAEAGTLVMVMGTSSCHMLNARNEAIIPGVAGVVAGGILPGFYGYETGQAAVGDALDWCRRLVGERGFDSLNERAHALSPGAEGVTCLDWMNGCRTPLMDGSLRGAFRGLSLAHGPEHLYRALLESSALGVRWIVDLLSEGGVAVRKFVATGGLPHHNPLLVQIYADVLGKSISVHPSKQGPALGAAILGVLAAGKRASGFPSANAAIRAMAQPDARSRDRRAVIVKPNRKHAQVYDQLYADYRAWAADEAK